MAGISSLLNISRSALNANTQAIRVIGNNIANVNTPGYTRRAAEITELTPESLQESSLGAGVEIKRIRQIVDTYLNKDVINKVSDQEKAAIREQFLGRAEAPFNLESDLGKIGSALSEFFSALDDLTVDPQSIPLRSKILDTGRELTRAINSSYNNAASLQREADTRIGTQLADVNRLTAEIADINGKIVATEDGSQDNLTLRDQRQQSLENLSKLMSFTTVENSDGSLLVSLQNGFGLVHGTTSATLEFTQTPSFAPVGGFQPGLDGTGLGFIVYDFDAGAGTSHADLTSTIGAGSGEIAGLLSVRGTPGAADTSAFDAQGDLVDIGSRIEAIARLLLTTFNTTYVGDVDEDLGTAIWEPSSGDLNDLQPGVYGLFTFTGAADTDLDGLATSGDLTTLGMPNYASILEFGVQNPQDLAAALDIDPAGASTNFQFGDARNTDRIAALRSTLFSTTVGNYSVSNSTIENIYNDTVVFAGGLSARAKNDLALAEDKTQNAKELQASVSGVSLDEEFAKLIDFQRAFEASARIIKTGDDLFGEILSLVG